MPRSLLTLFGAPLIIAVLGAAAVRATVVRLFEVPTSSMAPTLAVGDVVLASPFPDHLRRGDVVVFRSKGGGEAVIKRIVALPGDHVRMAGQRLYLNGREVLEPYAWQSPVAAELHELVPSGHVWVLGDNRLDSADSRTMGPVPLETIEARVRWVLFSRGTSAPLSARMLRAIR